MRKYIKSALLFLTGGLALFGLFSLLVPLDYLDSYQEYRENKIDRDLVNISTALKMYYLDNGIYPTSEQGLQALVAKPSFDPIPNRFRSGGYLPDVPKGLDGGGYNYVLVSENGDFQPLLFTENTEDSVFKGIWVKMPNK